MEGVFCGANKDAFLFLQAIRFWMTDSCVIVMKAHEGRTQLLKDNHHKTG